MVINVVLFASVAFAQLQNATGNCVSGTFKFIENRVNKNTEGNYPNVSLYDFNIDYGASQAKFNPNGSVDLIVSKQGSLGTRISTTRYMTFGRVSVGIRVPRVPGLVATFITMSSRGDEIDYEILGSNQPFTNVFYKGIPEYVIHGSYPNINGSISDTHIYTIDWKPTGIWWYIDGRLVRQYLNDAKAVSPMTPPGERWFPWTPSQIQFSLWDGCTGNKGTCDWAKGPINWGSNTEFRAGYDNMTVQCYDPNGIPVSKWPLDAPPVVVAPQAPANSQVISTSNSSVPGNSTLGGGAQKSSAVRIGFGLAFFSFIFLI